MGGRGLESPRRDGTPFLRAPSAGLSSPLRPFGPEPYRASTWAISFAMFAAYADVLIPSGRSVTS